MILFIDTAFDKTTLALKEDGKIYHEIISEKINISQVIIERTRDLLKKAELKKENIKIIGFNQGPGNFTSLRISLAYIKAIAFHLKVPIVSFNSFQILAMSTPSINKKYPIIVAVDARMNEVYWVKYKNFHDIFSKSDIYNLTPEDFLHKELENFNNKEINLIKNSNNILQKYNRPDGFIKEITIENYDIDLCGIFTSIEKKIECNDVKNIHDINLLYIRNDIAKKIK
jgi:tRNA threonylcarbamoyl adenosine modification protein YeaZ